MKLQRSLITGMLALGLGPAMAAQLTLGTATPPVGDGVQNLNFSTDDATNTDHAFVPGDYIGSEYRLANFGETLQMGQSFTTGSDSGYLLNSISVRQVSWTSDWDFDGGSVTLRVFDLSGGISPAVELTLETVDVPGAGAPTIGGTPVDPNWLTFELTDPLVLSPNTQYAFAISSTGGTTNEEFFVNLDGTAADSYAGGSSISVDGSNNLWNGGGGSDRAFVANMAIPTDVTFSQQPVDYIGFVGDTVTLSSAAVGEPAPAFQWEYSPDGFAPWSELAGETAATLTLDPAAYGDGGFYRVVASNTGSSVTSNEVLVDLVYPDPVISQQPASTAVIAGETATFTVVASGLGNLGYEWYVVDGGAEIPLTDGGDISGSATASLEIANVDPSDAGIYFVVVTDDASVADEGGLTETFSEDAILTIAPLSATVGTSVPPVGDGVQNLNFSTGDADSTNHNNVPSDYIGSEYRGDPLQMAQSFTTGSDAGYLLNSISVRQVSWGPTDWDYDGGIITLRIFDLSGATGGAGLWAGDELLSEVAGIPASTSPTLDGTPDAPRWLTFELSEPLALNPNTLYAFAISSAGGTTNEQFFMNLDGTATDSYAGGFSLTVDGTNTLYDGANGQPSDRAFVANMDSTGPGNTFASWIAGYDVGGLDGFGDDPDADGLSNGEESFLGTDPSQFSQGVVGGQKVGNTFVFQHPQSATPASDVTAVYRWTTDLTAWNADGATVGGTTVNFSAVEDDPVGGTTTVTATIPDTTPGRLFVGIEVTLDVP